MNKALLVDGDGFAGGNDTKKLAKILENRSGNHAELCGTASGSVVSVSILHDDWCRRLNRKGRCNCNPDVTLRSLQ